MRLSSILGTGHKLGVRRDGLIDPVTGDGTLRGRRDGVSRVSCDAPRGERRPDECSPLRTA